MGPVGPVTSVHDDGAAWYRVDDPAQIGAVRRGAEGIGRRLDFGQQRMGEAAIVAAELASNLLRHAREGSLQLRVCRDGGRAGLEFLAVDAGPGMPNMARSKEDGYSTAGTLGIGLGAVQRLANSVDAYSAAGSGTVTVARLWRTAPPDEHEGDRAAVPAVGGVTRPMTGEDVCGDAVAWRRYPDGRHQVMAVDGLGHGPLAAVAAQAAVRAFDHLSGRAPAQVLRELHGALSHTRGAAVLVADLDPAGRLRWCGIGNIAGTVAAPTARRGLVSIPGIVGHQARAFREFESDLPAEGALVLHSDGVHPRWDLSAYPGLLRRDPLVIAGMVLRDAGVRRDDASVLVVRP